MVFINKADVIDTKIKGVLLKNHYGRGLVPKGYIGLEIEAEGRGLFRGPLKGWQIHEDHSLRGESLEYVFDGPASHPDAITRIDSLFDGFKNQATVFNDSNRTSVHVHLNVNHFYLDRLATLSGLWFMFEDLLVNWCGTYRVGNLFCLRGKDAPNAITTVVNYIASNMNTRLPDRLHYSAYNVNAIEKFGSVEIRSLRGTYNPEVIKTWIAILMRLYEASERYTDPRGICRDFSAMGAVEFLSHTLGDYADRVCRDLRWSEDKILESMWEGMRLAQDVVYALDWGDFVRDKQPSDPFGRAKKPSVGLRTEAEMAPAMAGVARRTRATRPVDTGQPMAINEIRAFEEITEPQQPIGQGLAGGRAIPIGLQAAWDMAAVRNEPVRVERMRDPFREDDDD